MEYRTSRQGDTLSIIDKENSISIRSSALSSVGMVRGNNEDSVQLWSFDNFTLGLVADGMGGAAGGEEASRIAVEAVQQAFVESLPDDTSEWRSTSEDEIASKLNDALTRANQNVLDRAARDHQLHA